MAEAKQNPDPSLCARRERQLRRRLSMLLSEPETQLLMRADHVNKDDLMHLLIKTAGELHFKTPTHPKRKSHFKSAGPLVSLIRALRRCFDNTDG